MRITYWKARNTFGAFLLIDDSLRLEGSPTYPKVLLFGYPKDTLLECVTRRLDLEVSNVLSGIATM